CPEATTASVPPNSSPTSRSHSDRRRRAINKTGSKILHGLLLATSGLVGSTVIASTAAMAGGGPTGGTVAVGSATIVNASPTQTVVNQSSKKALINWNSFSIPGGSSVKFNQPNSKSLTVN